MLKQAKITSCEHEDSPRYERMGCLERNLEEESAWPRAQSTSSSASPPTSICVAVCHCQDAPLMIKWLHWSLQQTWVSHCMNKTKFTDVRQSNNWYTSKTAELGKWVLTSFWCTRALFTCSRPRLSIRARSWLAVLSHGSHGVCVAASRCYLSPPQP